MKILQNLLSRFFQFLFFSAVTVVVLAIIGNIFITNDKVDFIFSQFVFLVVLFIFLYELFKFIQACWGDPKASISKAIVLAISPRSRNTLIYSFLTILVILIIKSLMDGLSRDFYIKNIFLLPLFPILDIVLYVSIFLLIIEIIIVIFKILKPIPAIAIPTIGQNIEQTPSSNTKDATNYLKKLLGIVSILIGAMICGPLLFVLVKIVIDMISYESSDVGIGMIIIPFVLLGIGLGTTIFSAGLASLKSSLKK